MKFSISRLHTSCGIFRLTGVLHSSEQSETIQYEQADFMGSDGWQELDLESAAAKAVLTSIQADVIRHLCTDGVCAGTRQ